MKLFDGKSKAERNKTIAAIVLGVACVIVLFFAFGRGMFSGGSTTAKAKPTPTPKRSTQTAASDPDKLAMPTKAERDLTESATPIVYEPSRFGAPDAGRNIFAFYEPGKPTPYVPTPTPSPTPLPPPSPPPPPPIQLAAINPQSVYAGSNGFRLEIAGDRFTPDTKIYFEQQEIPSTFVNETRMTADIPQALIRSEGRKTLMAQTLDGTKISNPIQFDVQAPPKPSFQYIGMIARKRNNNDTAYFQEQGKQLPTAARLNDVVGGRFRVISISGQESILEDVSLGFKHKLALVAPSPTTNTSSGPSPDRPSRGFPGTGREVYTPDGQPGQPGQPNGPPVRRGIPGIPDNIPRYTAPPSNTNTRVPRKQPDNDEDDDGIDK